MPTTNDKNLPCIKFVEFINWEIRSDMYVVLKPKYNIDNSNSDALNKSKLSKIYIIDESYDETVLNPFIHFPWVKWLNDIAYHTIRIQIQAKSSYFHNKNSNDMEDVMVRYLHYGELDKYVYIISF